MDIYLKLRITLDIFELLAAVSGFIYFKKIRDSYWQWFPFYLVVVFITEVTGEVVGYTTDWVGFNRILYTYFCIPFQFVFFFGVIFRYYFKNTMYRNWPVTGLALYLVCWLSDIIFFSGVHFRFFSFSYLAGNTIMLILVMLFFITFISGNEILEYRSSMMFWVCAGLVIFYLLSLPLYGLWNTLASGYPVFFDRYWIVTMILNCMMYLLFIQAFIWGKPK